MAGVDYIFAVLGSDHPSIIEAYVKRKNEKKEWPRMIIFGHEFVAISAADAYARLTGKPQCVLVHVDVGTAAIGQGWHNASSGKVPILVFAGQAPYTLHGELPGTRTEHVHWYQDVPNQHAIVAPFSRYSNELRMGGDVQLLVNRALLLASTGTPGPAYLTAAREVLATKAAQPTRKNLPLCILGGIPATGARLIGKALIEAKRPLVVTGYLGRSHEAVRQLVKLADLIGCLLVVDAEAREMSFPANHPAWRPQKDASKLICNADVILVLDADVPWIPANLSPITARIFHIDLDPRKESMILFDINAEVSYHADAATALGQICAFFTDNLPKDLRQSATDRERTYKDVREQIAQRAKEPEARLSKEYLFNKLGQVLPQDSIVVHDAVTNQALLVEQLQRDRLGSTFSKGGSGLGWALGAAIGMRLASKHYDISDRPNVAAKKEQEQSGSFICMVSGDGAFMFASPEATFWAAHQHKTPFLSIILNNGGWKATRRCLNDVHPGGIGAKSSDKDLGIDLSKEGPDYCGIVCAATNGSAMTWKVEMSKDLEKALRDAVDAVKSGKCAFVEAVIP